jgi:hypothetical protein
MSSDLARFVESVNGTDPAWRESVDLEALSRLKDDELRAAQDLLIERVDLDDWRAPPALAASVTRGAVAPMKRRLPLTKGRMKIAIARALVDLGALPRADEIVAEVLREGDPDSGLTALVAAEDLRSEPITRALAWTSLYHPDPDARASAGATLLFMAGLAPDALAWNLRPLYLPLAEADPKVRREAYEKICEHIGMPPETAG